MFNPTHIEVVAFYSDDEPEGPLNLDRVQLDEGIEVSFDDEATMHDFFRWIARTFSADLRVDLVRHIVQHETGFHVSS
jgi:hypothetical protein